MVNSPVPLATSRDVHWEGPLLLRQGQLDLAARRVMGSGLWTLWESTVTELGGGWDASQSQLENSRRTLLPLDFSCRWQPLRLSLNLLTLTFYSLRWHYSSNEYDD